MKHDDVSLRQLARWGATSLPRPVRKALIGPSGVLVGLLRPTVWEHIRAAQRLLMGQRDPVREAIDIAACLAQFSECLGESMRLGADPTVPVRYVVEGRAFADKVSVMQRGAVLLTAHIGAWDLAGGALTGLGGQLGLVMAPERDPRAQQLQDAARAARGVKVLLAGDDPLSALPMLRHLRSRGILAIQIDRTPKDMRTIAVTLCSRPFVVPLGPFILGQMTGAPIFTAFTARLGELHHVVSVGEPFVLTKDASLEAAAARVMAECEAFLLRFPTQWFHFAPLPPVAD